MAFIPLTSHFEVFADEPNFAKYKVPGISGAIYHNLTPNQPQQIRQYGECLPVSAALPNQLTDLFANEGDTTVLVTITTLLQGVFTNCFKVRASAKPMLAFNADNAGNNGLWQYEIIWQKQS